MEALDEKYFAKQKRLWLAGAPLMGPLALSVEYTLECPCCVGLDGIDPDGSTGERDTLEDMGFSRLYPWELR